MKHKNSAVLWLCLATGLALGGALGFESVERQDPEGNWVLVEKRFLWIWNPARTAKDASPAGPNASVRLKRWHGFGLHFHLSEYHIAQRDPR